MESHNLVCLYTSNRNIVLAEVNTFDMNITNRTTFQTQYIPRKFHLIPFSILWIPDLLGRHVGYSDHILKYICVPQISSHLMCYKYGLWAQKMSLHFLFIPYKMKFYKDMNFNTQVLRFRL
jgi:hypothetical protein